MLTHLLICILGISLALTADFNYALEKPEGDSMNGSSWIISRVVVSKKVGGSGEKTICGDAVDNNTLSVLCSLSGYRAYKQLSNTQDLIWSKDRSIGYSVKCNKRDNLGKCKFTEVTDSGCDKLLIVNCTIHYKSVLEEISTNALLIPVILIPVCILYVIILCFLEYDDVRKTKASRKQEVVTTSVDAFQKGGNSNNKNNAKDGKV